MRLGRVLGAGLAPCALLAALGCGSGDATGAGVLRVTAYGEEFLEQGIAATDFADGWAISFGRFAVTVSEVAVAGQTIAVGAPVDLVRPSAGEGQEIGSVPVAAGEHGAASFEVGPIAVTGTAQRGGVEKRFEWALDALTRYDRCEALTRVEDGQIGTLQLTFHADHLFYDSLVSETPALRFQALADADADEDGAITAAELSQADIGAYDPGSESGVDDLWTWLLAAAGTVGHVDGEGHCRATPVGTSAP